MDNILYFAKTLRGAQEFLQNLSEQLHFYGIPHTVNYRNNTLNTKSHKIYAVCMYNGLIGALPGFRYYLNDTLEEEFNKRVRLKLLFDAKELKSFKELIELLRTPVF